MIGVWIRRDDFLHDEFRHDEVNSPINHSSIRHDDFVTNEWNDRNDENLLLMIEGVGSEEVFFALRTPDRQKYTPETFLFYLFYKLNKQITGTCGSLPCGR